MSQPSILQSLGGPLGGQKFEFRGGNTMVGSAPDCAVRLEAPGVEGYHARIVIDITGATIQRVDGPVGVNDDLVTADALLRSGDFVWIGEPGGAASLMFQFTLGDVEEAEAAPAPAPETAPVAAAGVEEVGPEDLPELGAAAEPAPAEAALEEAPVEQELMEMAPAPDVQEAGVVEESRPEPAAPEAAFEEAAIEEAALEEADEPMILETASEAVRIEPAPEPAPEIESVTEIESTFEPPPAFARTAEVEHPFEAPAVEPAAPEPSVPPETVVVPPAPWQMPAASMPEPAPAAEYASAWESPAPAPPAATPEATVVLPPTPPPAAPPAAPRPPAAAQTRPPRPSPSTSTIAPKRPAPASGVKIRTVDQDRALRTPPPPPPPVRTTSSMPVIVGGLVVLLLVAVGGFFLLRPGPEPVVPPPTSTPVVVSTPAPTPEATPEATQAAAAEPAAEATPEPTPEPAAPVAPTPAPRATPAARATPMSRATPTPRTPPAPARPGAAPTVATTAVAPAAPVSQAPRLLEEARAAMTAKDLPRAAQLLGEVLRLEPGNAEAATRKAEVDARMVSLGKKFVTGVTSVIGGKTAKGPSGFDLGGGGVVKTDISAQIRCTTTPTSVDAGAAYSIRCSILNIGAKAFRIEGITVNEVADGAKTSGAGVTPRGDIAPQADAVVVERVGAWSAKGSWSLEVIAKTTKDESFRAVYNWR